MTISNYRKLRNIEKLKSLGFSENYKMNFFLPSIHVEVINHSNKFLLHSPFYSLVTLKELKKISSSN